MRRTGGRGGQGDAEDRGTWRTGGRGGRGDAEDAENRREAGGRGERMGHGGIDAGDAEDGEMDWT